MKRYNSVYDGSYTKPHEMVEEKDGDWVKWEDVEALKEKCAELDSKCAELLQALQTAIALYGKFGAIVNDPHAPGEWISQARAAIAKAKGEAP